MNLSSYLQMPPAPLVPNSTSSTAPQGVRTGAGPTTGGNMGFDFAQVMARQIERLTPHDRQHLAALAPQNPEPSAREQETPRRETARRSEDQAEQETRKVRTSDSDTLPGNSPDSVIAEDKDTATEGHTRQRARPLPQKTAAENDALLLAEALTAPGVVAPVQTAVTPIEAAADTPQVAAPLQTIELSPQVRIITDPKAAPSPESLAAFAKSMGLDESTIQNLLGQQAAAPTNLTDATKSLPQTAVLPSTPLTQLQASMGAAGQVQVAVTPDAGAIAGTPQQAVSGAGLALSASTLQAPAAPGLTPSDMAAIQQIQITVLPAVVLPVNAANSNAPMPSTLDMLSLLGSGVDEQDVSALLTRFTEEANSDGQPPEQHESHSDSGHSFSSFSQALARNNPSGNTAPTAAAPTQNMSEVYDQLSDKMTTELAARMHKQLSDGEWKMKFGLRPANLGGVEIHLEMKDGQLDAVFHADNPLTRDLLQNSSQRLREALGNFGINAGQVQVGQGGGNGQQNTSGNSGRQPQVRDNSTSQVNGSDSATRAGSTRHKANASLLDLYA